MARSRYSSQRLSSFNRIIGSASLLAVLIIGSYSGALQAADKGAPVPTPQESIRVLVIAASVFGDRELAPDHGINEGGQLLADNLNGYKGSGATAAAEFRPWAGCAVRLE